ncbi:MAG: ribosomal protein S18-alanine N-acetyltransferase [Longimicrobiales bacterium]
MRNMVEADLERVLEVENTCYSIPWSETTFRGLLRRHDAEVVVAETDAAIIGHAVYWCVLDQGELGNVAVVEHARGRGVGGQLVGEIVRRAARRGVRELFLEVRPSNEGARHLYATHGFEQVGRRRNYYQLPAEDALVLRRTLGVAPAELER